MRRRSETERPPIPLWLLDGRPVETAVIRSWCVQNGYGVLDVLFAQRDAHRARWGICA